ncbi:hypothetical protein IFM89_031710 [Coptis chinensis]|uniref:Cytochrome P450 n=1 Tax=Coptis chinensis TaxID=261450 RepID=A0A835IJ97_9MAGN|nr:hypothetical protein IFM89_031710 [Coptis chinensis]
MVNHINSNVGCPIDIGEKVLDNMFHLITSMLWGGTLDKEDRQRVSLEFQQVIKEIVKLLGEPNVSDLFPALAIFDIQGMVRKMKKLHLWFDRSFDVVINQRLEMDRGGNLNSDIGKKDFLQVLLEFKDQEEHKTPFTITHIKALFLVIS